MSSFRLDCLRGKVAFVTGGGTGICKGICKVLMSHGADTCIVSRKMPVLEEAAKELSQATGRQCLPVSADVRDDASLESAVQTALKKFGHIDILVNGAAGNFLCPLEKLSAKGFKTVMEIDAQGTFNASQAVYKLAFSKQREGGVIINISATLHYNGCLLQTHAGAAKAAIDAMTKHMAVEWGPANVRVLGIAPGPIAGTEGMSRLDPFTNADSMGDRTQKRQTRSNAHSPNDLLSMYIPLQRMGVPADIGFACLFFCLPEAAYVTGQTLVVDGGQALTVPNFTVLDPRISAKWARRDQQQASL
uniref:2,4-dienoyl-CoA reductase [(3E)-enoyl-CoA-producing] n=2 Tax=Chromera velia TaxID=505693 RepID=A0A2K8DNE3_9ALVE|nr:2,4-dienoyl CoA reductase 2, peroxisomal family protein [Chromera velia]|mmetsp:Transcript_40792/g.80385  ORF Transcript_40792/g.80385 Transcript_40792/m.80385 type:complete len:304 (-) Transcript_40792:167-1078(-)|eukprot:Cvel_11427.t1-p1 / transcript=Cvel_11427.t1 / gene=Cvel_11427 / organism=Chromera_velia_CCMP2878 / gene_product=Peroxisomal 2,4-dienoyl-CoA reductase, putative / transcript_product=Peroxisomal 2,4-dienoyl-CoA reductase, putative / location=Cvel_scaffold718:39237-40713(-) / protein_length=303 / sequence_SO=supercontig / SO=protein_coding / is_pseudo=false